MTTPEEKLDRILDHIGSIDVTLARQEVSLADHIRRTAILEAQVDPIRRHVAMVQGVLKAVGLVGTVVAFLSGLFSLIKTKP
jgi:hypothetical protein